MPSPRAFTRVALAALSGLLLLVAFPDYNLWWCAPLGVASLSLAIHGVSARRGALLGWVCGAVFLIPLLSWSGVEVGMVPWLLLAGYQSLYFIALGAVLAVVQRLRWWPLWVATAWVAQEALRGRWPFEGFTWGRLAFSQADAPTLGLASVGGAPLISFVVALAGGLFAWLVIELFRRAPRDSESVLAQVPTGSPVPPVKLAAVGAVIVGLLSVGVVVPQPSADGDMVTIAYVQGGVPTLGLDFNAEREAVLRNHVEATSALAQSVAAGAVAQPDLVIWPENSSDIDPFANASAAALIQSAAADIGVPVLVGTVVVTADGQNLENTSIVWDPITGPGDTYVKRHPVPFGEYIPFRSIARRISPDVDRVARDFVAGDEVGVLRVGPADVGVLICFEVAYDDLPRDLIRSRAQVITVQTNNATFGETAESEQQLAMSRLRAVEHARTVVVASTSGISAFVEPDGSLVNRLEIGGAGTPVMDVQLSQARTLASRVGAWPELLLVSICVGAVLVSLRTTRRRMQPPRPTPTASKEPART